MCVVETEIPNDEHSSTVVATEKETEKARALLMCVIPDPIFVIIRLTMSRIESLE
jgi:hypothetical protein